MVTEQLLQNLRLLAWKCSLSADAAGASIPAPPPTSDALMAKAAAFLLSVNVRTS
jgi:hypothetical protein